MKWISLLFLSLIAISAHGRNPLDTAERDVSHRDKRLNALIMERDAVSASDYYDPEFVLTTSSGKTKSKQDMLDDIAMPALTLEKNETTNVVVRVRGSAAVLTGILHQRGSIDGNAFDVRLRVTDTWHLTEGGWVILAGHASAL